MKRLATDKQKAFMDQLDIEYDNETTLEEAKYLISEELDSRNKLDSDLLLDLEVYR